MSMKITIDTQTDSKEDIGKAITFLRSLAESSSVKVEHSSPEQQTAMMGMFDSPQEDEEDPKEDESPGIMTY